MRSSECSEPMFIGAWEAQTGLVDKPLPLDPFGFLVDYSEATWGPEGSAAQRPWETNDAGGSADFERAGNPPTFWFQVGVRSSSDAYPMPCYPLAVMSDTFRETAAAAPLARVDFALPLHRLDGTTATSLPSQKLNWISGPGDGAQPATRAAIHMQSGTEDAFTDDAIAALREALAPYSGDDLGILTCASGEEPIVSDGTWQGPGRSFLMTTESVAAGSLPRIGWLTGLIAEALASRGVDRPVYVSWRLES